MNHRLSFFCLLMMICLATPMAWAAPKPAIVRHAYELDFTYKTPRPIAVLNDKGDLQWFWYMTYTVTNHTGKDRLFLPEFTLAYDTGKILDANHHIPSTVFKAIFKKEHNPLLKSPLQVVGKILQGKDFARQSVIIWPHFKKQVKSVKIFVAGLSGETAKVTLPKTKKQVLLRKTLMISYGLPGVNYHPQDQQVLFRFQRWIMR